MAKKNLHPLSDYQYIRQFFLVSSDDKDKVKQVNFPENMAWLTIRERDFYLVLPGDSSFCRNVNRVCQSLIVAIKRS